MADRFPDLAVEAAIGDLAVAFSRRGGGGHLTDQMCAIVAVERLGGFQCRDQALIVAGDERDPFPFPVGNIRQGRNLVRGAARRAWNEANLKTTPYVQA